jgi:hypothetical protein
MVSLAPIFRAAASAGSSPASSPPITGSSRMPDPAALVPSTAWKYCGIVNSNPTSARMRMGTRSTPQVKVADRNSARSRSG